MHIFSIKGIFIKELVHTETLKVILVITNIVHFRATVVV